MSELVVFDVGGVDCAIDMRDLISIAAYETPVRLPGATAGVSGIIPFLDKPLLLIHLGELFSVTPSIASSQRCIAVVNPTGDEGRTCGFIIDRVKGVLDETACADGDARSPIPSMFVRKTLLHGESAVTLLAVERIHDRATGAIG
jgi:chemotaxis signal transduction protein